GIPTGNRGRGIYPPMRKRGDFSDQLFRCVERSRNWTLSPGEDHGDKGVGEGFASREIRFIDSSALMTRFNKKIKKKNRTKLRARGETENPLMDQRSRFR